MTESQMYWLLMLDSIGAFSMTITIVAGVISIAGIVWKIITSARACNDDAYSYSRCKKRLCSDCDSFKTAGKLMKYGLMLLLPFFMLTTFLPTTKQMAAIIIVPKICSAVESNEQLKQLPNNLFTLANEWMEELRPPKKAEQGK